MASRFVLHLRAGASAAARSARGHTYAPAMASTMRALGDAGSLAGRIHAIQGVRHYGTPCSNHSITKLNRAMRKVERRLDALEGKGDIGHKPLVQEVLTYKPHEKEHKFDQFVNVVTAVGWSITFSVAMYYRFPWHAVMYK